MFLTRHLYTSLPSRKSPSCLLTNGRIRTGQYGTRRTDIYCFLWIFIRIKIAIFSGSVFMKGKIFQFSYKFLAWMRGVSWFIYIFDLVLVFFPSVCVIFSKKMFYIFNRICHYRPIKQETRSEFEQETFEVIYKFLKLFHFLWIPPLKIIKRNEIKKSK